MHCFKRRHSEKALLRTNITVLHLCSYSVSSSSTYRPSASSSFLFPAETDVLIPVLSQSTDVVVMNFVVVLKFPNIWTKTDLSSPVKRCNFIFDFFNPEIYFNLMQPILFEYCYSNIKEMLGYFVRTGNYQKLNISIKLMYWNSNWKTAYQTAKHRIP